MPRASETLGDGFTVKFALHTGESGWTGARVKYRERGRDKPPP